MFNVKLQLIITNLKLIMILIIALIIKICLTDLIFITSYLVFHLIYFELLLEQTIYTTQAKQ